MSSSLTIIGSLIVLAAVAALIFWPRRGFMARLARTRKEQSRSALEDVLKHAYDCQSRSVACTIESVAGVLQTSIGNATRIVSRVEAMGLVT
jgi:gas vesicle protein